MLTDERNFYSPQFFQHAERIPTNKTNCNGRKRSQTHTYELHNDGWRTHTNGNEFFSGPIRKYTQVDVGGCSSMCELTLVVVCLCVSWRQWLFVYVWVDVGGCSSMCEWTSVVVCLCVSWRRWLFVYVWVDVSGCSSMCELTSVVVRLCVSWRRWLSSMCELTSMCEGDFKLVFTWCFIVIDAYIHIEDKTAGKIMKSM